MDKVICVGKNYLKHAQELGDAIPSEPLYFFKPPSAIAIADGGEISIPARGEIHHELELVLKWDEGFTHFTFGLDLTDREMQGRLKKAGQPWEKAKVFRNSAILGPWLPVHDLKEVLALEFQLQVNGVVRQKGRGVDMRWSPQELIQDLRRWFPLCKGDLLFTGTPEGVGPLKDGDQVLVEGGGIRYDFRVRSVDE